MPVARLTGLLGANTERKRNPHFWDRCCGRARQFRIFVHNRGFQPVASTQRLLLLQNREYPLAEGSVKDGRKHLRFDCFSEGAGEFLVVPLKFGEADTLSTAGPLPGGAW